MEFIWYGVLPTLLLFMCATTGNRVFILLYLILACVLIGSDFHGIFLWIGCQMACWCVVSLLRFLLF